MNDARAATGLPEWRRAGGTPAVTALVRASPEDFRVDEIIDFELDGGGEHDWLRIEKRGVNTAWLARRLAGFAGVPARDVGFAGMKDRHAVTRQWFSIRRPGGAKADWSAFREPGVRVLEIARHARKLKRGAHRGNAFELTLRELDGDAESRLAAIAARGVPNYFGEQRFGHAGGNLDLAASLFAGRRLPRERRALALSAARGFLFNEILAARVLAGTWDRLEAGDVAVLDGTGSVFDVTEPDAALERRAAELDVHPSGALWGRADDAAGSRILPSELAAVDAHATLTAGLERLARAGRRALRLKVADFEWTAERGVLLLRFRLTRGGFATAVLREVARTRLP